jgi:bacteriocin biosynthesis cyclodehydratase domain-containing protein
MIHDLTQTYLLRPNLRVSCIGEEHVFLHGEQENFRLSGRLMRLLLPQMTEAKSAQQLIEEFSGVLSLPEVLWALDRLLSDGLLISTKASEPMKIAVQAINESATEALERALIDLGFVIHQESKLKVFVASDFRVPALGVAIEEAITSGVRCIPVKLTGRLAWVGPILDGNKEEPCWQCLLHRLWSNRPIENFLQRWQGGDVLPPQISTSSSLAMAAGFAAQSIAQAILAPKQHSSRLLTFDLSSFQRAKHMIVKRPQCVHCGDVDWMKKQLSRPVQLQSRPKNFTSDGGFRTVTPEQTFERLSHHVSPITGVIASLGPIPERDHPLRPVYGAAYFVTPHDPSRLSTQDDPFVRPSMGKGRTPNQSRVSALCEALERYASVFQGDEAKVRASFRDLEGDAVDPRSLLLYSEKQYQHREQSPQNCWKQTIPLPHRAEQIVDWTPVWSLSENRLRYLPTAYCFSGVPQAPQEKMWNYDPNGNAAGNCLEEAILQGLLELIERDAAGIWWYNRLQRPSIDLESFGEPYFTQVEKHYQTHGYALRVLDVTTDIGIPVVIALAHQESTGRYTVGFGAHIEARLAVQRALTEMHQIFDPTGLRPVPWTSQEIEDPRFLFPSNSALMKESNFPCREMSHDLTADVQYCIEQVSRVGLEVLVLDYTRPDLNLHTVKVVVPGLRHFWPRFGLGRLYDVPVQMGLLPTPLGEEQLNPLPLLL